MNTKYRIACLLLLMLHVLGGRAENFLFTSLNASDGLSDNQVRYILQLSDGRMVFTTNGNLNLFDGSNFKYLHRNEKHIHSIGGYDGHYRIYQEGDSLLWIKEMGKLMCVDVRREVYVTDVGHYLQRRGVIGEVDDVFVDGKRRLWILQNGCLKQVDGTQQIDLYADKGKIQDLWADETRLYLFYDTGEVVCYNLVDGKELYARYAYGNDERACFDKTSLVVASERGFYQLRNGTKGGLFFFDVAGQQWSRLLETDYVLNTLIASPNEKIYVSCANGIWTIDALSGEKQYLPALKSVSGVVYDTEISTLFLDKQGGLWLGTLNRGLLYYHPRRYRLFYVGRSHFPDTTKDIIVRGFAQSEQDDIYVNTSVGYYKYIQGIEVEHKLEAAPYATLPTEVKSLFDKEVHDGLTLTDHRGWQWAGTQDGLELLKPGESEPRFFYTEDGLVNNSIRALIGDSRGCVWVTTSYGISKIEVDDEEVKFINYNSYDGALDAEYVEGASFQTNDGVLCFGGVNGFNLIYLDVDLANGGGLLPIFTALYLKGERVEVGESYDGRVVLEQSPAYTDNLVLGHNQNFLTLEFSAANYRNPSQTCYKYKMQGVDSEWRNVTNRAKDGVATIAYTGLPSGEYCFEIMASDNYGWDGRVRQIQIVVLTPWWRTWWAYLIYTLVAIGIIGVSIYLYQKQTKERIERKHKEEILLLRIKNLIEQCNLLETENKRQDEQPVCKEESEEVDETKNPEEAAFMARAIDLVERNLYETSYTVEQLSRDLCMDRTGLYRKLVAMVDQTPSLFIRSIRLQKAAQLIVEGELTITEISDRLGFSTPSYMSRCFQEMYGCRPSEYAKKRDK